MDSLYASFVFQVCFPPTNLHVSWQGYKVLIWKKHKLQEMVILGHFCWYKAFDRFMAKVNSLGFHCNV